MNESRNPQKMSTCNRLDLETLGCQPIVMYKVSSPWTLEANEEPVHVDMHTLEANAEQQPL
jgi:hypothetical protein